MGKVQYVLLDCDNTLCQSERLAFEACADLTNELMKEKKIDAHYTLESLLEDFVGFNFRGMLKGLQKKHDFTMTPEAEEDYVSRELGAVTAKLKAKCTECPGVTPQLEWIKSQGYPMSVVSTSAKPRVVASLEKTNLDRFFPNEHVYSAATSMEKPSSKPDPAIYLYACEKLGVKPADCVTVEDSKSGATAALRAGIPLIAYVGIYGLEEGKEKEKQMAKTLSELPETLAKDLKERGVKARTPIVMYDWKEFPEILKQIEAGA